MLSRESIELIEAKAEDVLKSAYQTEVFDVPVNLEKIALSNGLKVENALFTNEETIGLYDRKEKMIFVRNDMLFSRKAFTIAHELGHHILHEDKKKEVFLRLNSLNIDIQEEKEEAEANWFAASLLMPKKIITEYYKNIKDLDLLAEMFGVSKTALVWRLKNLWLC